MIILICQRYALRAADLPLRHDATCYAASRCLTCATCVTPLYAACAFDDDADKMRRHARRMLCFSCYDATILYY